MPKHPEGQGSHPIPEFSYYGDCEVLGVQHIGLVHDSGSRITMPAASVFTIAERPEVAEVVARVAGHAAEHHGYHRQEDIADSDNVTVLKTAEVDLARGVTRRASIYRTRDSGLIIKAFDKAPTREAVAQYAVMTALHAALRHAPDGEPVRLRSPEQYALVQPPVGKHRTIVMEAVAGIRLYDVLGGFAEVEARGLAARQNLSRIIKPVLEAAVQRQVDPALLPYINDITGGVEGGLYTNLIVPAGPDTVPTTSADVEAMLRDGAIIDQPRFVQEIAARGWSDGIGRISKLLNTAES